MYELMAFYHIYLQEPKTEMFFREKLSKIPSSEMGLSGVKEISEVQVVELNKIVT